MFKAIKTWNPETTKSLIRHFLTAVGAILVFLGLNAWIPVTDYIVQNLDGIFEAILFLLGVATTVAGFFREKARFEDRT